MTKQTAEIVIRALLAIVAALQKEYGLPNSRNVTILLVDGHDEEVHKPP